MWLHNIVPGPFVKVLPSSTSQTNPMKYKKVLESGRQATEVSEEKK